MGAWGIGPFENDDAADFRADLAETPDVAAELRTVLTDAVASDGYLEAPSGVLAVAAAAIVAVKAGNVPEDVGDEDREWIEALDLGDDELATLAPVAASALDRVGSADSELLELWDEADETDAFLRSVAGVRRGLPVGG